MIDPTDLSSLADPAHTALVVVDVQNDFCDPTRFPASIPMLPTLSGFIDQARAAGLRVIWTRAVHNQFSDTDVWRSRFAGRSNYHETCREGSTGAEMYPGFEPRPEDLVIFKHRYSAFIGTSLEHYLRAAGIQTVLMTGIATNVCVESTARDAFQRDFYVVLVPDCTATTSELLQRATEENIASQFGRLASSAEVMAAWQRVPALAR